MAVATFYNHGIFRGGARQLRYSVSRPRISQECEQSRDIRATTDGGHQVQGKGGFRTKEAVMNRQ